MNRVLPLLIVAACGSHSEGVRVLGPEAVELQWDGAVEGSLAVVPVDLLAYDAGTGEALPAEPLSLRVVGAELSLPQDRTDSGPFWDVVAARPVDLLHTFQQVDLVTDEMGAIRVLVVVEEFEERDGCAVPVELVVDAGSDPHGAPLIIPVAPRVPCR